MTYAWLIKYCRSGYIREILIFANFATKRISRKFKDPKITRSTVIQFVGFIFPIDTFMDTVYLVIFVRFNFFLISREGQIRKKNTRKLLIIKNYNGGHFGFFNHNAISKIFFDNTKCPAYLETP